MIDGGRTDMIVRAVRAARQATFGIGADDPDDPARQFLAELNALERTAGLIRVAWAADEQRADLVALFHEAEFLLAHLPEILAGERFPDALRGAGELILEIPETQLRPFLESLSGTDHVALRAMLDALAALPGARLAAIVEPLLVHPNPRVRRIAFGALASAGTAWRIDLIRRALADPDHTVQRITLDQLANRTDEDAVVEALTDFIGARIRRAGPKKPRLWRDTYRRAAAILAGAGPDGLRLASETLADLLPSLTRQESARARELAGALGDHRNDPETARVLGRWAFSGARLVGAITGARLPEWEAPR